MTKEEKVVKSFNLKKSNVDKIEKISFEKKIKQSKIVDDAIEELEYGSD